MSDIVIIGPYTVGEKPAPLVYQFLDHTGAAVDLTGYTAKFQFHRSDSAAVTVRDAVVTEPSLGKVTYTWTGMEFITPGKWWFEFWVGNTVNLLASKRLDASVRAPVGAPPSI